MGEDDELEYDIPEDVSILVTHGPPFNFNDRGFYNNARLGSLKLQENISVSPDLRFVISGHIHGWGYPCECDLIRLYYNVSCLNEYYKFKGAFAVLEI